MYIRQGSFGQGLKFTFTGYQIPREKEERSSWVIKDESKADEREGRKRRKERKASSPVHLTSNAPGKPVY